MASTAEVEVAAKQVDAQLSYLKNCLAENDANVNELEQRLSDVLMDRVEKEGAVPEASEEPVCALADRIRVIRRSVENQNDQVKGVLRRLEL